MRQRWTAALTIAGTLCLSACSDDTVAILDKGTPKPDQSKVDTSTKLDQAQTKTEAGLLDKGKVPDLSKVDSPAGVCNALVNTAPVTQEKAGTGTMPTLTGGTIVEGKYHRTETVYWSSPKTRFIQETIKLTKTSATVYKMEFVNATSATTPPSPEYHVNVELTPTGGAAVNYAIVCGTTGSFPTTYQATATTLTLRLGSSDLNYTLQP